MKANIGELDIPPGWRTLGGNEHVEPNDEIRLDDGTWRRASLASLGKAKLRHETYRRNINIAGEGWRLLEPTELTTEGDETKVNGNWREIDPSECGYPAHSPLGAIYYRRRTECRPTDAEAEEPGQNLAGEGWRWLEVGENLQVGDEIEMLDVVEGRVWTKTYPGCEEHQVTPSLYTHCRRPVKPVTTLKTKTICVCSKCNKDITDENEGFIVDGGIYLANPNEMMGLLGPTGKHAYCRPCFCEILNIGLIKKRGEF